MTRLGAVGELESARVARILRDDIVQGRRLPGDKLIERDIAAELDVSRLPVREAIRALVAEGIVVVKPRSWAVVREFTLRDLRDLSEIREAVETLIFVFATERHDEAGIERLRVTLEREETAAREGDVDAARTAATQFHQVATELAGNEMIDELIRAFVTRLRWLFGQHDDLLRMAAEHRSIFDAMAARDADAVRVLVRRHLREGQEAAEHRLRTSPASIASPAPLP